MSKGQSSSMTAGLMEKEEIGAIVDPIGHSWKCTSHNCSYGFCQEIKKLITNTKNCTSNCKELIYFLRQHNNNCKEAECDICNFVVRCNVCAHNVETGQGWYCKVCPNFEVCNRCYQKEGIFNHPHKLTTQNEKARQEAELKVKPILDVLLHSSKCQSGQYCHQRCRKMKALFHHGKLCEVRFGKGCPHCNKMWYILRCHAEACKEAECSVPRCKDLKEHLGL
ncbi:histone acetyltransferase HAC12-like [Carex rostrata]